MRSGGGNRPRRDLKEDSDPRRRKNRHVPPSATEPVPFRLNFLFLRISFVQVAVTPETQPVRRQAGELNRTRRQGVLSQDREVNEFFGIDHQGPLKILREIREQLVDELSLVPLVRQRYYFEDGAVGIKEPDADFVRFQGERRGRRPPRRIRF